MKSKVKIILATVSVLLTVLIVGAMACYQFNHWRQARLLKHARQYLQDSETRKALLCLQNALSHDPDDIEACRLMASLTEATRSPSALAWRSRVLELAPRSLDDRVALAQTALIFGDATLAANVLGNVEPGAERTAKYFNTAGLVSMELNRTALASQYFGEASRLEPFNEVPRFNLALLRLQATEAEVRDEARTTLARISTNGPDNTLKTAALRELARDALRRQKPKEALEHTDTLLRQTNCLWIDQLLRLEALMQSNDPCFPQALATVEKDASLSSRNIYEFATWEMKTFSENDALNWLESLPPHVQTNQPATLLLAECLALTEDWHGLYDSIATARWDEWEFVRHAFMARALQGEGMKATAATEWAAALKSAGNRLLNLNVLLRLSTQWNWPHERQDVLWRLVESHPEEHWATEELGRSLFAEGRTRSLIKLWNEEWKRFPTNLTTANNLALAALLLDAKEVAPDNLARELYGRASTNVYYASTYAFSLYRQGKYADALGVMNRLSPEALETPAIAGYYGLLLKATGQDATARAYLQKGSRANLLPEERRLFEQALAPDRS